MNFTNRYEPFSELSILALKSTAKIFDLNLSDEQIRKLNEAKLNLDPFPDSEKGLEKLNEAIRRRTTGTGEEVATYIADKMLSIVLSNGDADKSDKLLYNSGLRKYFDYIISAEEVGMQMCWISREDKKENGEIDIKPDYVFSSIENMGNNLSAMLCSLRHYDVNMNMM